MQNQVSADGYESQVIPFTVLENELPAGKSTWIEINLRPNFGEIVSST